MYARILTRLSLILGMTATTALQMSGCATTATSNKSAHTTATWISGEKIVHRWTLKNGLKLVVLEDHSSPTFAWQTWFRVGSRDEQLGRTGLAHLFEHMMFKGTKTRADGEFDRLLDEAGAEGQNAFTSNDHTAYVEELPIDSLDLVASLESERMRGLIVDENAFKTEREVVQNERRMRTENSPDGMLYQELFGLAFVKQSYRWPVIGYARDLEQMNAQDAREFYDRWYRPNNATIVVVGDVRPDEILALVERKYGSFEAGILPDRSKDKDSPPSSPRFKQLEMNIQTDKLMIGYPAPEALHGDTPAILMLDAILAAGNSSRLHRALVETGIASSVYAYPLMNVAPSLYIIGASLQSQHHAAKAEKIILSEIAKLSRTPPTSAEIERALNQMEFSFFEGLNSNSEIANFLGQAETDLGGFEKEFEIRSALKKVTAAEIQKAASNWLREKTRSTVVGTPKKVAKQEHKK